jgi:methanogenic corrinoid protein MtbC1
MAGGVVITADFAEAIGANGYDVTALGREASEEAILKVKEGKQEC